MSEAFQWPPEDLGIEAIDLAPEPAAPAPTSRKEVSGSDPGVTHVEESSSGEALLAFLAEGSPELAAQSSKPYASTPSSSALAPDVSPTRSWGPWAVSTGVGALAISWPRIRSFAMPVLVTIVVIESAWLGVKLVADRRARANHNADVVDPGALASPALTERAIV